MYIPKKFGIQVVIAQKYVPPYAKGRAVGTSSNVYTNVWSEPPISLMEAAKGIINVT